ncbi:MAG: hypothetical protein ACJAV5_002063, partial [Vicingaceae bacterium]
MKISLLLLIFATSLLTYSQKDTTQLVLQFNTNHNTQFLSDSTTIYINLASGSTYNYDVDWNNDGIFDSLSQTMSAQHDYGVNGTYIVRIRGVFPRINL